MALLFWSNPLRFQLFRLTFDFFPCKFACSSPQAEIIIVKCFILGRINVTRVRVELRSCYHDCHKNDTFFYFGQAADSVGHKVTSRFAHWLISFRLSSLGGTRV